MIYSQIPLAVVDADVLVLPWFEDDNGASIAGVDAATGGELQRALGTKELSGRLYEIFLTSIVEASWKTRRLAFIGAGCSADFSGDLARKTAAAAGLAMKQRRVGRVAFAVRAGKADDAEVSQAVAEGLTLSEFNAGIYKTNDVPPGKAPAWTIVGDKANAAAAVMAEKIRARLIQLPWSPFNDRGSLCAGKDAGQPVEPPRHGPIRARSCEASPLISECLTSLGPAWLSWVVMQFAACAEMCWSA
jgi:hypothetical protein